MDTTTASKPKRLNQEKVKAFFLNYSLYIILFVLLLVVIIKEPSFLSARNFIKIIEQASTRGILALGVAGLIVLAGTDLSVGRIVGCCAAITAALSQQAMTEPATFIKVFPNLGEISPIWALLASIGVGVFFTTINGFGVAKLKMHAFIVSLGTQLIAYGALLVFIGSQKNGAQPISSLSESFNTWTGQSFHIFGEDISIIVVYFVVIAVLMWLVWNKTTLGKNMFAIGGNMEAAAVSGVNVERNIMFVYILAGALYGISSFLETGYIGTVDGNTGLNYDLDAISGCVIGGVSFSGGVGTIPGAILGILILQAINFSLVYMQVNPYYVYIIKGAIIIAAVAIDVRKYLAKK